MLDFINLYTLTNLNCILINKIQKKIIFLEILLINVYIYNLKILNYNEPDVE